MEGKILDAARTLFNEQGYTQVSIRSIANYLSISPGNLTYHFKKKDDLVQKQYENMIEEVSVVMQKQILNQDISILEGVVFGTLNFYRILWKYRFFMVDFVFFMRSYPKIGNHFNEIMQLRDQQFLQLFVALRQQGIMQSELQDGHDKELLKLMFVVGNFWISQELVINQKLDEKCVVTGVRSMAHLMLPYICANHRAEFLRIVEELK